VTECEICGRSTDDLYEIKVEGAMMLVCRRCSAGKEVLHKFGKETKQTIRQSVGTRAAPSRGSGNAGEGEEEIVDNYGEVIRSAREALGLPLRVLAEKINETESSLARIERQRAPPSEKVLGKLEKELGIKLTVKAEARKAVPTPRRDEPLSIWDVAKKKGHVEAGE
jgi:putative transcription factor